MPTIGPQTVKTLTDHIEQLLRRNIDKMEEAYCNLDNELSVSISIKIAPNKKAGTDLTTKLSFTAEKVTEKFEATVDENQMSLPLDETEVTFKTNTESDAGY